MSLVFDACIHHITEITLKRRHWKRDDGVTPYETIDINFINEKGDIVSFCAFGENYVPIKVTTLNDEVIDK
jgi:hypothetical protein